MAAGDTLNFQGKRWQTACAAPVSATLFEITATGHGRKWTTDTSLGFWRSFAELPLNDGEAIAGFVQRYGDPWGELDARKPVHTAQWGDLASGLAEIADAWDLKVVNKAFPRLAGEVSLFSHDPKRKQRAIDAFRNDLWPRIRPNVDVGLPAEGTIVGTVVRSLAAFMVLSAGSALLRRVPMRRCQHCGHWLEMDRSDRRFCSSSCRVFFSQQRKEK
jgi:hypothetical protein